MDTDRSRARTIGAGRDVFTSPNGKLSPTPTFPICSILTADMPPLVPIRLRQRQQLWWTPSRRSMELRSRQSWSLLTLTAPSLVLWTTSHDHSLRLVELTYPSVERTEWSLTSLVASVIQNADDWRQLSTSFVNAKRLMEGWRRDGWVGGRGPPS